MTEISKEELEAKEKAKERSKAISELMAAKRKEHAESAKAAQQLVKDKNATRKIIKDVMQAGPHTVLQIAKESGLTTAETLWHVAAMRKYGEVVESGVNEDGEYYLYSLTEVKK
jgi:predicted transcriptional regulator